MSNYANAIDNYSREQSGISNFASNYKQGVFENRQKDLENWRDNVSKFKAGQKAIEMGENIQKGGESVAGLVAIKSSVSSRMKARAKIAQEKLASKGEDISADVSERVDKINDNLGNTSQSLEKAIPKENVGKFVAKNGGDEIEGIEMTEFPINQYTGFTRFYPDKQALIDKPANAVNSLEDINKTKSVMSDVSNVKDSISSTANTTIDDIKDVAKSAKSSVEDMGGKLSSALEESTAMDSLSLGLDVFGGLGAGVAIGVGLYDIFKKHPKPPSKPQMASPQNPIIKAQSMASSVVAPSYDSITNAPSQNGNF